MVCIVFGCQYGSTAYKGQKRRTFTIPKGRHMKQKWLEQINRKGFHPKAKAYVCEIHFLEEDFLPIEKNYRGKGNKKRQIRPLAYPKQYLRGEVQPIVSNENIALAQEKSRKNVLFDHMYFDQKSEPPTVVHSDESGAQINVMQDHSYVIDYELFDIQSETEISGKFFIK